METNNRIWSTRDLSLASALVTLRFRMTGIDLQYTGDQNRPIGFFKFLDTAELQETKDQFNQGLILVEPKQFMTNMKSLKSEIINLQSNPHQNNQ